MTESENLTNRPDKRPLRPQLAADLAAATGLDALTPGGMISEWDTDHSAIQAGLDEEAEDERERQEVITEARQREKDLEIIQTEPED